MPHVRHTWTALAVVFQLCLSVAPSSADESATGAAARRADIPQGLDTPSFTGLWTTTYGAMRLTQHGAEVSGTYQFAGVSRIRGTLKAENDRVFRFTYDQPDGETGEGEFTLSEDGARFDGTWRAANGPHGRWSGTRAVPEPGRTWLIVLESHWEAGIQSPEYAFGEMLRSFFSRLPNVSVRHRFVHDLADLQRFCGEVAFIAEPVVLYISSHGTPDGVSIGAQRADAEQLINCVRDLPNLRLLHFGACAVMAGTIPEKISAAMPPGAQFPISGFTEYVDWAGSAVVDFTYMELVLGRGVPPVRAVEQTRAMLSFARPPARGWLRRKLDRLLGAGGSIAPTGLAIYDGTRGGRR